MLRVVLIEPEFSGNLGSVARAMGNMGCKELVLVKPQAKIDHIDAKSMSVAAYPILQKARIVASLPEALSKCHWSVGFTRRAGRNRCQFLQMSELAAVTQGHLKNRHKVAFVFGPEKRGFTTNESAACHQLVQIPTSKKHPSLNLAQAVIIALYELNRSETTTQPPFPHKPETMDGLEGMYKHLEELLFEVRYFDAQNTERVPNILRRLFNRAQPTAQEVRIVRGMCRNALNELRRK